MITIISPTIHLLWSISSPFTIYHHGMKHLTILLCVLALAWCSLTTQPSEPITNSWSTESWTTLNNQSPIWIDLMSGEDLTLTWSTIFTGATSGDMADSVAYIQDNNVRVRSWSQLIQLTKNWWRTDLCDNGEPLEYLDPQINGDYLLLIVRCKDESSYIYVKDIKQWWSYPVSEWNIAKRYKENILQINNWMFCTNLLVNLKNEFTYVCQDTTTNTRQKIEQRVKSFLTKSYFPNIVSCANDYDSYIKNNLNNRILWYNILWYTKKDTIIFTIRRYSEWTFSESPLYLKNWVIKNALVWINELNNLCIKGNQMGWIIKMGTSSHENKVSIFDFDQEKIVKEYVPPIWRIISYPSFHGDDVIDITNSGNKVIIKHYDQELIKHYYQNANKSDNKLPKAETVVLPL